MKIKEGIARFFRRSLEKELIRELKHIIRKSGNIKNEAVKLENKLKLFKEKTRELGVK